MYYYRPRRSSTTRPKPSVSRNGLRQDTAHPPLTTEAPERHEPPGATPATATAKPQAQQPAPMLDTQTLLLLLPLLESLVQAAGAQAGAPAPASESADLVVESEPPAAADEEDTQDRQPARSAQGSLTFYNAAPSVQTIGAGMLLTGSDGVQVVTEQDALIPAVAYPTLGQVTVAAHAVLAGPGGNIGAGDIYGPCCRLNVSAVSSAFGGGQDARSYPMVTREDMSTAVSTLTTSLLQSVEAAFGAQLHEGETLITPVPCTPAASADHAIGREASHLTVTVDATCTGESYRTQAMHDLLKQVVSEQASTQLGTGYSLAGDVQATVMQSRRSSHQKNGTIALQVTGTGTWLYQFDDAHLQRMTQLIAGKSRERATQILLQLPGVKQVSMNVSGTGSTTNLPADSSRIHVLVLYRSA